MGTGKRGAPAKAKFAPIRTIPKPWYVDQGAPPPGTTRSPGRPALREGRRDRRLQVMLDEETCQTLEKRCQEEGVSISTGALFLLREALGLKPLAQR